MNPQKLTVTFIFNTTHSPDSEKHLSHVLRSTLQAKGLHLTDNNEIYV